MAAASLRRIGISLPAMRRDGGRRLEWRDVAKRIGRIGADWPVETRDFGNPNILVSGVGRVELEARCDQAKIADDRM